MEQINTGRQPELDIAKAVIIFLLAFIHCTIECTNEEALESGIPYLLDTVIGGPLAAPMFMFAMGVGMVYTRKKSAADYAARGVRLLLAGFILNICRYTLPFLLGYAVTSDYNKYISPLPYRTLCNDILQFAGIAMLLIALFRQLKIRGSSMLILMFTAALIMSAAGTLLNGTDTGVTAVNIFLGYFIGTEDASVTIFSDFPLLNWFIVPVSGYIFGNYLIHVKDKKNFYRLLSPLSFAVAAVYFIIGIRNGSGMFGDGQNCYYHIRTDDILISIVAVIGMLGIYYRMADLLPERLMRILKEISGNITKIYCIHWVILVLTVDVLLYAVMGTNELPVYMTLLLSLFISIAAITAAHMISRRKNLQQKKERL